MNEYQVQVNLVGAGKVVLGAESNHNPELIRENGDFLERSYADFILNRIPGYAHFWAKYIGNNGRNIALSMPGVPQDVFDTRTYLWEHLYTLFESVALCWRLEEEFDKLTENTTRENYADNLNWWIAFYAHLGRIHDMAEKVAEKFQGENLYSPFDLFYEQRHIVLHDPKVPMWLVQNVLTAPRLGEKPKEWHEGMRWSNSKYDRSPLLAEIITSTLRDLEKVVDTFFYKIAGLASPQQHFVPIEWPEGARSRGRTVPPTNYASSATSYADYEHHPISPSGVAFVPSNETHPRTSAL